jgi:hypothetical protein
MQLPALVQLTEGRYRKEKGTVTALAGGVSSIGARKKGAGVAMAAQGSRGGWGAGARLNWPEGVNPATGPLGRKWCRAKKAWMACSRLAWAGLDDCAAACAMRVLAAAQLASAMSAARIEIFDFGDIDASP